MGPVRPRSPGIAEQAPREAEAGSGEAAQRAWITSAKGKGGNGRVSRKDQEGTAASRQRTRALRTRPRHQLVDRREQSQRHRMEPGGTVKQGRNAALFPQNQKKKKKLILALKQKPPAALRSPEA